MYKIKALKNIVVLGCFIITAVLSAKEAVWVTCQAEVPLSNITMAEAKIEALRRIRQNAIDEVCGVMMQSETFVRNFIAAGDFIHAVSYGEIIEEKNMKWSTKTVEVESNITPPMIVLQLNMDIKVRESESKPDPFFKVKIVPNKITFNAGEELQLKVTSTQDCYLTVLNLAANDTVYVLFPNGLKKEVFVKANTPVMLPDKELKNLKFHLRVYPMPYQKESSEIIKVIATREKMPILEMMQLKTGIGQLGTPHFAMQKLVRLLSEIPMDQRTETTQMITIQSRE